MAKKKSAKKSTGKNPEWLRSQISKGEIAPVYFLHGPEDLEKDEAVRSLIDVALDPASRTFNLDILVGNELDVSDAINRASAFPMMGSSRVVVIKRIEDVAEASARAFIPLIENPVEGIVLIFTANKVDLRRKFFATLKKAAVSIEFKIPYDNQLPGWIRSRATGMGLEIDDEALHFLALSIGGKPREIANELEKLDIHLGDRRTVSKDDISLVIGASRDASVFDFTDAVGGKNLGRSLRLLQTLMEQGDDPVAILALLIRHVGILRKTRWLLDSGTPRSQYARKLKIPPFTVGKYAEQAGKFTDPELWSAYETLLRADNRIKSRSRTHNVTLTRTVTELCASSES
ncbi:MAG: DNA polymerase III subunit delta [Candidatus Latescibacterota bacterium]|nr:DNA polymerase III subunit delta [Candidatus Latescibacterota bacterium]